MFRLSKRSRSRNHLAGLAIACIALALAGCGSNGSTSASGDDSVVFAGYGGATQEYMAEAWFEDFTDETGIEVIQASPNPWAKLHAMADAGKVAWDVMWVSGEDDLITNPDLAPIDCKVVACSDFDGPAKMKPQAVPFLLSAQAVTYSTEAFPDEHPESWADFFDVERFPGTRAVQYYPGATPLQGVLEYALLASGVPAEDVYPLDIDRALAQLDKLEGNIIFTSDPNQCAALLASGEAVMGDCYSGKTIVAMASGDPLNFVNNQPIMGTMHLVVPKNSPNPEAAQKLVAFLTSREQNGGLTPFIKYDPGNPHATYDPALKPQLLLANSDKTGPQAPLAIDYAWWIENQPSFNDKVTSWVNSQ